MLGSKTSQSLEKSILDDFVNWKWDQMQIHTMIELHPSLIIKENYHLLFPLTSLWYSVCFPTDDYSNYKIRINSWYAESLFILICVAFKERNSNAHSLQLGAILKTWTHIVQCPRLAVLLEVHRLRAPVRGVCDLPNKLSRQICSLMNNT